MALDFPTSPALNEIYTYGGRSWKWNGTAWDVYSSTALVSTLNGLTGSITVAGGTAIGVSTTAGTITVTNTGVQSFNGLTGAVTGVSSIGGFTGTVTFSDGTYTTVRKSSNDISIDNVGVRTLSISSGSGINAFTASGTTGTISYSISNTGVTGIQAGTGISVSSTTGNPTITNIGVQSFNGLTGAVTGVTTGTANTFLPVQTFSGGIIATGATLTSPVYISGLGIPTTDTQAANKAYVDSVASVGIHYHDAVVLASTDSETFNTGVTYNNGTSGVGATLRKTASFARINIDSTNGSTGDRIMIRSAATQQWNGIYSVTNQGDGTTGWILTRTADADNYHPYENDGLGANDYFFVTSGSSLKNNAYICNNVGGITFGTTAITFAIFSTPPVYTAGTGLALNSLQFSNTGVLSVNGSTGAVTGVSSIRGLTGAIGLTNGNGIDLNVSGNTLTVSNSGVLTVNGLTGTVINIARTTDTLAQFASTTSAELATLISNETGSGSLVFAQSPAIVTSLTTSSATFALVNTIATTLNLGGAATTLTIGATSGTASIRNPTLTLGNTNNTIQTNSGTTNYLAISPYGNLLFTPTTSGINFGSLTSLVVTNSGNAQGQVQISGGDLYLGTKTTNSEDFNSVNIIFEGASDNANETTLTVVDPTADRTITFPDASGTVALTSGLVSSLSGSTYISVSGSTGAVTITNTGVQTFNGLTGAVTGVTVGGTNVFTALNTFNAGISASGVTLSGSIGFQNAEYIRNTTNGRMDFMPAPAGSTHYGMYMDFTSWSYGVKLGTIRASDSALNAAGFLWEAPLTINGDVNFNLGSNGQNGLVNSTIGNNTNQFYTNTSSGENSGAFAIVDSAGVGTANRSPGVTHTNPNLYVYRSGNARANDFVRMEHDGTVGRIVSGGTSGILLQPGSGVLSISGGISASGGVTFGGTVASDTGYRITSNAIKAQTGTTYTFIAADNGEIVTFENGSTITVTVPTGLPVGFNCTAIQLGTGAVGFTAASGVTLNAYSSAYKIAGQHGSASLISYATNIFNLSGSLNP